MFYYLLCSDVCSLGHCVASCNSTLPGSICDVAVRHSHILIVARGRGPLYVVSSTRSYYMLMMGSSRSHVYDGEVVSHNRFPFMRPIQLNPGPSST